MLPAILDEVKVTDPPEQNVVAPLKLIVGVSIETDVIFEVEVQEPLVIVTE
jgi:hypothetical protein